MDFIWKTFDALSTRELYAVLELRQQVFVLEQQCLYSDIDGADPQAQHLLCYNASELAAYLRVLTHNDKITIGRVVVAKSQRGQGLSLQLLTTALEWAASHYPNISIYLSAQVEAQVLYARLGFAVVSQPYDDGGILHVDMCK